MTRITRIQFGLPLVITVLALTPGCGRSPGFSMVGGGGSAASDGWWFSSGSIFLRPNEPGVLFGMQKTPDGNREFSYFVLFRHTITGAGANVQRPKSTGLSYNGDVASMRDGITINGRTIEFDLELHTDKDSSTISSTQISIDGNEVDPAKGTVFLVDLTSDTVTYEQFKATLPGDLPEPKETATVTKLARHVTQQLISENDSVREFLVK